MIVNFNNSNEEKPSQDSSSKSPISIGNITNNSINCTDNSVKEDIPSGNITIPQLAQKKTSKKSSKRQITIADVKKALKDLGISVRYNVISGLVSITGMPSTFSNENADAVLPELLLDYFIINGMSATKPRIEGTLIAIMDENRFNPVVDIISKTTYDGQDRIRVIEEILGIVNIPFSCTLLRKWLHQCIAMAYNDDIQPYGADGVLVIQGPQGEGKTLFCSEISLSPELFAEGVSIDMNKKDSVIQSTGVWIAELGELDSTLKREQSSLKAFITGRRDTYRIPYAKNYVRRPRRTSFCATVNPEEFLNDETGSRRFWVIHVDAIDVERLKNLPPGWAAQMWRQVFEELYVPNPQGFRLTAEERKELQRLNKVYEKPLPGEIEITDRLNFEQDVNHWVNYRVSSVIVNMDLMGVSAAQVGRVLAKLAKNDPRIKVTNPHNVKHYLLPRIQDPYN